MTLEIFGIIATIIVLISMSYKTDSHRGSLFMRWFNILGSIMFVVYGILLPAISTALLNGILFFINTYHLILLYKIK